MCEGTILENIKKPSTYHCTHERWDVMPSTNLFYVPQATDEQIFQAVRRLVAAEIQAITFREYLPSLLGGTEHMPVYQGYNQNVDVGMSNMMSTAAFR